MKIGEQIQVGSIYFFQGRNVRVMSINPPNPKLNFNHVWYCEDYGDGTCDKGNKYYVTIEQFKSAAISKK